MVFNQETSINSLSTIIMQLLSLMKEKFNQKGVYDSDKSFGILWVYQILTAGTAFYLPAELELLLEECVVPREKYSGQQESKRKYLKLGMNPPVDHGFKVCRVCISPPPDGEDLVAMFEDGGEIARQFILISGVDISFDFDRQNDVLICKDCLIQLSAAYELRAKIEEYEELYFETRRLVEPAKPMETGQDKNEKSASRTATAESPFNVGDGDGRKQAKQLKKVLCDLCPKTFSSPQSFQRHKAVVHEKSKPLTCRMCLKKFALRWNLKAHIIGAHFNGNFTKSEVDEILEGHQSSQAPVMFKCDLCSETLPQKEDLKRHMIEKHTKKKLPKRDTSKGGAVPCPICLRLYKNYRTMRSHLSQNHLSSSAVENTKFQCQFCKRFLSSNQSLKQHVEGIHYKIKKFGCKLCPQKFNFKSGLKLHLAKIHPLAESDVD